STVEYPHPHERPNRHIGHARPGHLNKIVLRALSETLRAGKDVVVDHGFWTPDDRARWQSIATSAGAVSILVYLEASHEELWSRVNQRNVRHEADPNSIYFAESDLLRYRTRFVPPQPNEPHVVYDGDPETVLKALEGTARLRGR
ncbi:AAA family ATPase, partial [Streptomyces sp. NPDC005786]|uniref:AAA family ATPase n=1 Tax=Streptomyces sp. NPDC005786 TaxID=3154891 RepID=UPI0033DBDC8A